MGRIDKNIFFDKISNLKEKMNIANLFNDWNLNELLNSIIPFNYKRIMFRNLTEEGSLKACLEEFSSFYHVNFKIIFINKLNKLNIFNIQNYYNPDNNFTEFLKITLVIKENQLFYLYKHLVNVSESKYTKLEQEKKLAEAQIQFLVELQTNIENLDFSKLKGKMTPKFWEDLFRSNINEFISKHSNFQINGKIQEFIGKSIPYILKTISESKPQSDSLVNEVLTNPEKM